MIEADCSTKYLRRFLEIRDAPKVAQRPLATPSQPAPVAIAPGVSLEDRRKIFKTCQEGLFDLAASPTLIDPSEAELTKIKYNEIWNSALARHSFTAYRPTPRENSAKNTQKLLLITEHDILVPLPSFA